MTNKTPFELRYLVIPDFVFKDNQLSLIALKVYGFIHSYTNPFFFSNDHLAEMFNCHPQTVSTAIGQLEKLGYITTEYRNKADGGKIRLSVDAHSDSVSTLIRVDEKRAPTKSGHSDKDIKDNNLKGKKISNNEGLNKNFEDYLKAKKEKKLKGKVPFGGIAPRVSMFPVKKERKDADGTGII